MGFPRQESWSGLPFPSPGDLSHPEIERELSARQADSLPSELPSHIHPTNTKLLKSVRALCCVFSAAHPFLKKSRTKTKTVVLTLRLILISWSPFVWASLPVTHTGTMIHLLQFLLAIISHAIITTLFSLGGGRAMGLRAWDLQPGPSRFQVHFHQLLLGDVG